MRLCHQILTRSAAKMSEEQFVKRERVGKLAIQAKKPYKQIMHEYDRRNVEEFFAAIEPNLPGYKYINFSYLALKNGDDFDLTQGRLQLQGVPVTINPGYFHSKNIKAGMCKLSELNLTPIEFVESLLSGKLKTPHGELLFKTAETRNYSSYFDPYHQDGLTSQRRQMYLSINGARRNRIDSTLLDWELKAAATPFFNIQELCDEFSIGTIRGDSGNVEILAYNVAGISLASIINQTKAKLAMDLAEGLDRNAASIGYRTLRGNQILKRGQLTGKDLTWENVNDVQHGVGEIEVPLGAVLDCITRYAGVAQSHYWITDPKTAQNPLRAVHHAFDNNLDVLHETIVKAQNRGANARDLEIAISWLIWMLGFSPTHIGGTARTSDAPDLIAATPRGDLVVIECTTGILKEDSKLSHLVERSEKVRQSLIACGNQHLKVLPVIVTTKTREEVKAELDQANKLGVLVATREDFPELTKRTMLFPDPNGLYTEAEETLKRLQAPLPPTVTASQ